MNMTKSTRFPNILQFPEQWFRTTLFDYSNITINFVNEKRHLKNDILFQLDGYSPTIMSSSTDLIESKVTTRLPPSSK